MGEIHLVWLRRNNLGTAFLFLLYLKDFLGDMPDVNELENPDIYVASEIISSDGVTLGKLRKKNHSGYL